MVKLCLLVGVVSLCSSAALCRWMVRLGHKWGNLDTPGSESHKAHDRAVPNLGGVAITWSVVLPMAMALGAVWLLPASVWTGQLAPVARHLAGLKEQTPMAVGILISAVVLHVMGLVDDRRKLSATPKLAVQLLVAVGLVVLCDMRVLEALSNLGPAGYALCLLVSVLWVGVVINAMNMLDNMDGLAGGVGAIIAAVYTVVALAQGQWFVAALCALVLGALVGFLVFNFPPAKLFMGDGGSQVVGLLLAVVSVRTTYTQWSPDQQPEHAQAVIMPLLVMAIPLYDFVSVTLIRTQAGKSPFVGDNNHLSHRLVRRGLSRRSAVLVIWGCTLATALGGVELTVTRGWLSWVAVAQVIAVIGVLAMLERGK
ncbi:MAG: hypothetical protein GC164_12965 [Phycisphaera sp.]|nr:hypothetical protein [Phycisphaera sp.]